MILHLNKNIVIFLFILIWLPLKLRSQVIPSDSLALVSFYQSTNGIHWKNDTNWLSTKVSLWYGVKTDSNRVVELFLNENNLKGQIPDKFYQLSKLENLYLMNDSLTGNLEKIHLLNSLKILSLANNQFSDSIPETIGNLTKLEQITLSNNQLNGRIPKSIKNLSKLTLLNFSNCNLSKSIPTELFELTNLSQINLSKNKFTDSISTLITNIKRLKYLYLNNNQLSSFPDVTSIDSLISLNLMYNKLGFEDIEPSVSLEKKGLFYYSYQDSVGKTIDTVIYSNNKFTFTAPVSGKNNFYWWYKNDILIDGTTINFYTIDSLTIDDAGKYYCLVTNTIAPKLEIAVRPILLDVKTSMIEEVNQKIKFTVYPNPFTDFISIKELNCYTEFYYEITKITGEIVKSGKIKFNQQIQLNELKRGIYFIHLKGENKNSVIKIIKN